MVKKLRFYIVIPALLTIVFFTIAGLCNQCNVMPDAAADTTDSNPDETGAALTTAKEPVTETTAANESIEETSAESSNVISMIDISQIVPVFAIANETGDKLISYYGDVERAMFEDLNGAIGQGGQFYSIEYVAKQKQNDQDNGRVISTNFDNMAGYVYRTVEEKLVINNTYFLCSSDIINGDHLLQSDSGGVTEIEEETKTQVEDSKEREVQNGWIINEYSNGNQVLVIVFEPQESNLLMSIALKTNQGLKFMDYPAVSDGQSVWRVDDGGEINPELFSVLFAVQTSEGLLAVINWAGAEGENTLLLLEKDNDLILLPWEVYRYWSAG